MLRVGVMGTGYVGLVHGAVLSGFGFPVICMDVDSGKIQSLQQGIPPIYEPSLAPLVERGLQEGTLAFTDSAEDMIQASEILFIAVGTPSLPDGSADLTYVREVVNTIAKHMNGYKLIVCKSTLPVGSSRMIASTLEAELRARGVDYRFEFASNPEFLRQGNAVSDAVSPSRVVIGVESEKAKRMLQTLYQVYDERGLPFVYTNLESAEMIKYASNAFLAVKISYINELALLAEKVGANIEDIAHGMGLDGRIS